MKTIALVSSCLAVIDQLAKYIAVKFFAEHVSQNTGVAFSVKIPYPLLIVGTIILLALVAYLAYKELNIRSPFTQVSVALILGGGLGNLTDRLVNGYVVDFIKICIWPAFNLADIFITVGVLLILVFYGKLKPLKQP